MRPTAVIEPSLREKLIKIGAKVTSHARFSDHGSASFGIATTGVAP